MTAAGCCFLFINFCNFEFQPSSINYSRLTKNSTALPRLSSKRTIL
ncbi:AzlC family protein [Neisseria meningitidis]|nr:AzlC family protein [Neisseria meningitidis]